MRISFRLVFVAALVAVGAAGAGWYLNARRSVAGPSPDSDEYRQLVSAFYRGLAALDTGLLDNAQADFTRATVIAPMEPSGWANLGLVHLRRAEPDAAAQAINRAAVLAPDSSDIEMLKGALELSRGNLDAAIARLRRAAALDPRSVRPRFALAEALERARETSDTAAGAEAEQLLDAILALQPDNLAVLVERTRLAARRGDATRFDALVARIAVLSTGWPAPALEQLVSLRAAAGTNPQAAGRELAFLRNVLAPVPA
ncbi:MAG: tetratricopeptide repeat protein, partial [Vicinamibacterales bacterium]